MGIPMADVVEFPGATSLDSDPDRVLESMVGKLETVVVVGYCHDGSSYLTSNVADNALLLWMLERAIHNLHKRFDEDHHQV